MSAPAPEHKAWFKQFERTMAGRPVQVFTYWDDPRRHRIDVITADTGGGAVGATIGLMDRDQSRDPAVRVFTEIIMDSRGPNEILGNVLSTIAFFMIKDGWKAAPGVVFERMIEMYAPELSVQHALFLPPIQWGDTMGRVDLGTKTIHPLWAVPITDAESALVRRQGSDALETLWEQRNTDVFDWRRKSAV